MLAADDKSSICKRMNTGVYQMVLVKSVQVINFVDWCVEQLRKHQLK